MITLTKKILKKLSQLVAYKIKSLGAWVWWKLGMIVEQVLSLETLKVTHG